MILTVSFTLLVYLGKLILDPEVCLHCQNELENSSNDTEQLIDLPKNKFDLYNKLAKSMYLCLIGINLFIIVVVYFVPLLIKQAEHLLPNKAVSLLNWVLRYRYLTYYFFGFLLLNNLLSISLSIIAMVNNPI